jgi:hypothetical protein
VPAHHLLLQPITHIAPAHPLRLLPIPRPRENWAIFLLLMLFYGLLISDLLAVAVEGLFIRTITPVTIRDKKLIT